MIDRGTITAMMPAGLRLLLRPLLVPCLNRLERPRLRRLYGQMVAAGDLVFDIGAAEGYHTLALLDLGARVVCVEPQPAFVEILARRFGGRSDVILVAAGASDHDGEQVLHVSRADPELSTFAVEDRRRGRWADRCWEDQVLVRVTTLDALIADHGRPVFTKIDVEGLERQVLLGLGAPVAGLCFEFSSDRPDQSRACIEHLSRIGMGVFNYSAGRQHRLREPRWLGAGELLRVLEDGDSRPADGDIYVRSSEAIPA